MMMQAIKVCDRQDEAAWLEARRSGIGASEMPMVMECSSFGGPFSLYEEKLYPQPRERPTEGPLARGLALEPIIYQMAADKLGIRLEEQQALLRSRSVDWMLATLDSVDLDNERRPVEAKSALFLGDYGLDGSPTTAHVVQTHQQMAVVETKSSLLVVLGLAEWSLRVFEVTLNEDLLGDAMLPHGDAFWECVTNQRPPPLDVHPESIKAWLRLRPMKEGTVAELAGGSVTLVEEWRAAKAAQAEAQAQLKEAEAAAKAIQVRLMDEIGSAEFGLLPDGRRLSLKTTTVGEKVTAGYSFRTLRTVGGAKGGW